MPDFDLEDDFFSTLPPEQAAPRPRRGGARGSAPRPDPITRIQLEEPLVITGSPTKAPPVAPTPEELDRLRRRELEQYDNQEHSPFWDALTSPVSPAAAQRTSARVSSAWDRFREDPVGTAGAAASGALQGVSGGLADEILGAVIDSTIMGGPPGSGQEMMRDGRDSLRARAPEVHGASEVAGLVGSSLVSPSLPATQAPGLAGAAARVASSAGTGALYGAASGVGYSDPDSLEEAGSAALEGGVTGAAFGGALGAGGEVLRGPTGRMMERMRQRADDQLLGATTSAGRGDTAIRNFVRGGADDAVAARGRSAQTLRETGAVPPVGTVRQVHERLQAAQRRIGSEMEQIANDMAGGGPTGPEIAERILADLPTEAAAAPQREAMERLAEQFAERYGTEVVPQRVIAEEARRLRQAGAYQSRQGQQVSMPREALQEVTESLRGAYDDVIESTLGADRARDYQRMRRQYAVLQRAIENAEVGTSAAAGNRAMGLSEQLGLYGGGAGAGSAVGALFDAGPTGAAVGLATAAAARGLRAVEPTLRATGANLMYQAAQRYPQSLGRFGRVIQEAGARGPAALASTHYVLMQRDEEYRRLVQEFEDAQENDELPEAVRRISDSE